MKKLVISQFLLLFAALFVLVGGLWMAHAMSPLSAPIVTTRHILDSRGATLSLEEFLNLEGVEINTADHLRLVTLPGIGDTLASRILEYRQEHGLFVSLEGLMQVKGIGEKTIQRILPFAYVDS